MHLLSSATNDASHRTTLKYELNFASAAPGEKVTLISMERRDGYHFGRLGDETSG